MAGKIKQLQTTKKATAFEDSAENLKGKVLDLVGTIQSPLELYLDDIKELGDDPNTVDPVALTGLDPEDVADITQRKGELVAAVKVKTDGFKPAEQAMLKQVLLAVAANLP